MGYGRGVAQPELGRQRSLRAGSWESDVETVLVPGVKSQDYFDQWWMSAFPDLAIFTVVMAFNLVGDGIRDALDPRLRRGM